MHYNFDSLTLNFFVNQNREFFENSRIQKVQQPSYHEIILTLRNKNKTRRLYFNIKPEFAHICFIDENDYKKNPKHAAGFCMLLRKYIVGAVLRKVLCIPYERILELHFEAKDELGENRNLCFACELMGKHSNLILYNSNTATILGCAHGVSAQKSSVRELKSGLLYVYPPKQAQKKDIENVSYDDFLKILSQNKDVKAAINENFYYFTKPMAEILFEFYGNCPHTLYEKMQEARKTPNSWLFYKIYGGKENINFLIKCYYGDKYKEKSMRENGAALKKEISRKTKALDKILSAKENSGLILKYQEMGNLILRNLDKIKKGDTLYIADGVKIPLNELLTPSGNAQRYFKLYKKLKTSQDIHKQRKEDAQNLKNYYEELNYYIDNVKTPEELEELEETLTAKTSNAPKDLKKNKFESEHFKGREIYIGKNAKENQYLLSKIASGNDFWFHAKDYPSAHIICKNPLNKEELDEETVIYCAKKVKEYSAMKDAPKASVVYAMKKHLKKHVKGCLGLVVYSHEKEIVIE